MKKIVVILVLCIIIVFCLVGCKSLEIEKDEEEVMHVDLETLFVVIKLHNGLVAGEILVHKETKVMYLGRAYGNGGGLTVMLDENGKPLLWEGELE